MNVLVKIWWGLILEIMFIGDEKICKHNIKKKVSNRKKGKNISLDFCFGKSEIENILSLKRTAFIHLEAAEGLSMKFWASLFSFQHDFSKNVFLKRMMIKPWVIMMLVLFFSFIKLRATVVIVTHWIRLLRIKIRRVWWKIAFCGWNIVGGCIKSTTQSWSLEFLSLNHTLSVLFVKFLNFLLLFGCPGT